MSHEQPSGPGQPTPAKAAAKGDCLNGLDVLVVDDNPTNRLVAKLLLETLGARTSLAEDGLEGVAAAEARRFDLILMDIQMPRMDGVEAARRIRTLQARGERTPILACTANLLADQRADYLAAGMDGVVAKPIVAATLLQEVVQALGVRAKVRAA